MHYHIQNSFQPPTWQSDQNRSKDTLEAAFTLTEIFHTSVSNVTHPVGNITSQFDHNIQRVFPLRDQPQGFLIDNMTPNEVSQRVADFLRPESSITCLAISNLTSESALKLLPLFFHPLCKIDMLQFSSLEPNTVELFTYAICEPKSKIQNLVLENLSIGAVQKVVQALCPSSNISQLVLSDLLPDALKEVVPALRQPDSKICHLVLKNLSPHALHEIVPVFDPPTSKITWLTIANLLPEAMQELFPILLNPNSKISQLILMNLISKSVQELLPVLRNADTKTQFLGLFGVSHDSVMLILNQCLIEQATARTNMRITLLSAYPSDIEHIVETFNRLSENQDKSASHSSNTATPSRNVPLSQLSEPKICIIPVQAQSFASQRTGMTDLPRSMTTSSQQPLPNTANQQSLIQYPHIPTWSSRHCASTQLFPHPPHTYLQPSPIPDTNISTTQPSVYQHTAMTDLPRSMTTSSQQPLPNTSNQQLLFQYPQMPTWSHRYRASTQLFPHPPHTYLQPSPIPDTNISTTQPMNNFFWIQQNDRSKKRSADARSSKKPRTLHE